MNFKSFFFSPIQNSAGAISFLTQPSLPFFFRCICFCFPDIAAILLKIPARQQLNKEAAIQFCIKPGSSEVMFPLGSDSSCTFRNPSSRKRVAEMVPINPKGRKSLTRTPNASSAKFNSSILPNTDIIDDNFAYLHLPDSMQTDIWKNNFIKLIAKSVSSSSWHKYRSALNKLKSFSSNTKSSISWPLTEKVINGFTLWCLVSERLKPSTVKAYILAFSKLQKLKKMNPIQFSKSIADYLSMGADHSHIPNISHSHKQPVTFKILKSLKSKSKVLEDGVSFWAICSCAFFGSFRMGELVSSSKFEFDSLSTLLWEDIKFKKSYCKIHIKSPKSNNPSGDTIYLFPFPNKKLCPVKALCKLKRVQKFCNNWNKKWPVFIKQNGEFWTKKVLNRQFRNFFPEKNISSKSFRAAIPSILANHPDVLNDRHVMGWGRWRSSAFLGYQIFKRKQRRWVFDVLSDILIRN